LAYDAEITGDLRLPNELVSAVSVPTLVITGNESWDFLRSAAARLAEALPNGQLTTLPGETHHINPEPTAEALALQGQQRLGPSSLEPRHPAAVDLLDRDGVQVVDAPAAAGLRHHEVRLPQHAQVRQHHEAVLAERVDHLAAGLGFERRLPQAERVLLREAGHFSMEDRPTELARALADWLEEDSTS